MKNKISLIILSLYTLIIIILAFNMQFINDINIALAGYISKSNVNLVYNILHYMEIVIFYMGYSILLTIVCIEYFTDFKYILIYSIILNILMVVIVMLIKSFKIEINIYDLITMIVSVVLGIIIELVIKIKQIRGGKYEE